MTRKIARQGIIATVYVVLGLVFGALSYGAVQFRIAEILKILPYYNKRFTISITLGCFIVNLFSPLGIVDIVFGTLATVITCKLAEKMPRLFYVAPVTGLITGLIVGAELYFVMGMPFLFTAITVLAGEFIVVLCGVAIGNVLEKNHMIISYLKE